MGKKLVFKMFYKHCCNRQLIDSIAELQINMKLSDIVVEFLNLLRVVAISR